MFLLWVIVPILAWIVNVFYIHYKLSLFIPAIPSIIVTAVIMIPAIRMTSTYTMCLYHFVVISWIIDLINLFIKNNVWQMLYKYSVIPFVLMCMVIAYGFYNMNHVTRHEYNLNAKLSRSYKIILVSDMHYGISLNKEELHSVVERINEEKADLLLLGGDIFDESTTRTGAKEAIDELSKINTKYGSYYVYGNHDKQLYTNKPVYTPQELSTYMENKNIHVLEDEVVSINDEIDLIGRKDQSDSNRKAIDTLPIHKQKYTIVLDHQPVDYQINKKAGVNLDLSGHTHAGQIFPIGLLNKLLPTTGQYIGYKRIGHFEAVVTSGIAGWGYPIRTEGHSEYAVIKI